MKKKFKIIVDCANCAQKVEDALNKMEGVTANVNFMQERLTVEAPEGTDLEALTQEMLKVARKVEPDVEIIPA